MANTYTVNKSTGAQTSLITGEPTYPRGGAIGSAAVVFKSPGEFATTRKLYAIGNNEFWYESSPGVMSELVAANGDIDITGQLMSSPGWEKVFIANGDNLKVADFKNQRLTSEAIISSNVPSFGDILTQANTSASIVVDYIYYDTTASDHYIYGRDLDTGTWNTTDNVVDSASNVIITGANLSAIDTGPLWYDYTPYNTGQVTTYDGMPTNASIIALYRGRIVLAGDNTDPNQWYMARQNNPYDWAYTGNPDAQQPVSGEQGQMGKAGDIIKALIPYKDDYLIIGGEHTMSVMRGDPADNGSLDTIDETIGIYGSKSWTFDSEGNLYFFGTGGIYKMPKGFGQVIPISKNALPKLG